MADTGDTAACDVVTVPARQGLEAVDLLRLRHGVGPVLHDREGETLGFLVPPGTAARWNLPGSACTRAGSDAPVGGRPSVAGSCWLVPPEGAVARATEPERLRAAIYEAVNTLAVVDRCGGVVRR
ncbi:hypothetical protein FH609_000565 [Streptomyces sp. 3MP-14]|uniref:Uncharacterized protein n=1 Tax=Streptomyces mimosae TaxID=2586635 RepID=A0A5N6AQH9_9ACTN|nr:MULTISPECIES: hypothetical protein [Streptomyces]KAB8171097.1 hypothetical protein FH607_001905 [Streptomyces mimosae]KAB8179551.1 hypothetical protein FH609_000565 [Streptomyces sp. 3MP-14]